MKIGHEVELKDCTVETDEGSPSPISDFGGLEIWHLFISRRWKPPGRLLIYHGMIYSTLNGSVMTILIDESFLPWQGVTYLCSLLQPRLTLKWEMSTNKEDTSWGYARPETRIQQSCIGTEQEEACSTELQFFSSKKLRAADLQTDEARKRRENLLINSYDRILQTKR